jgi:hypothetical protein
MSETATRSFPPWQRALAIAVGAATVTLVLTAGALWANYGTAVFVETILAGLNACF